VAISESEWVVVVMVVVVVVGKCFGAVAYSGFVEGGKWEMAV
jgi:hypothetical protein